MEDKPQLFTFISWFQPLIFANLTGTIILKKYAKKKKVNFYFIFFVDISYQLTQIWQVMLVSD